MDRFAVIGDPITHSLSPVMQEAAFRRVGIHARYEAQRVPAERLAEHVAGLREMGYRGFNVTVPHKVSIVPLLDNLAATAMRAGAVNTVSIRDGKSFGDNTDVPGFTAALRTLGLDLHGLPVTVIGAGGSARAVVLALSGAGARLTIVNRSPENARQLLQALDVRADICSNGDLRAAVVVGRSALVINTTPLGMAGAPQESPLPSGVTLAAGAVAVDLVYGDETPFLASARAQGCRTMDGLEMLVQQGAESFRIWTGLEPDLAVMRDACRRGLREALTC